MVASLKAGASQRLGRARRRWHSAASKIRRAHEHLRVQRDDRLGAKFEQPICCGRIATSDQLHLRACQPPKLGDRLTRSNGLQANATAVGSILGGCANMRQSRRTSQWTGSGQLPPDPFENFAICIPAIGRIADTRTAGPKARRRNFQSGRSRPSSKSALFSKVPRTRRGSTPACRSNSIAGIGSRRSCKDIADQHTFC